MKNTIILTLLISLYATMLYVGSVRSDRVYCQKLQAQAEQYPNFYITVEENEMCFDLDLPVNALIK